MYDKLLKLMEPNKETVSFFSRMETFDKFLQKHDLYKEIFPAMPEEPLSIIWSVTGNHPEVFEYQIKSLQQFMDKGILFPYDELIVVADKHRKHDVLETIKHISLHPKIIIIDRLVPGDRPVLNWDIGMERATYNRGLFVRDLVLFFHPYEFIRAARKIDIEDTLTNITTVLGPVWARFSDTWLYLIHPDFAPNPFMFSFVAPIDKMKKINGFDRYLSRGFDHCSELDFLLRWNMAGFQYNITDEVQVLHPGLPASQEEIEEMKFQSAIIRRYFFDRYGEEFISRLKPPYNLEAALIEVNHALTLNPLSSIGVELQQFDSEDFKDIFSFAKIPSSRYIVEEVM